MLHIISQYRRLQGKSGFGGGFLVLVLWCVFFVWLGGFFPPLVVAKIGMSPLFCISVLWTCGLITLQGISWDLRGSSFEICIYFCVGGLTPETQLQCTTTYIGMWSGKKRLVVP